MAKRRKQDPVPKTFKQRAAANRAKNMRMQQLGMPTRPKNAGDVAEAMALEEFERGPATVVVGRTPIKMGKEHSRTGSYHSSQNAKRKAKRKAGSTSAKKAATKVTIKPKKRKLKKKVIDAANKYFGVGK